MNQNENTENLAIQRKIIERLESTQKTAKPRKEMGRRGTPLVPPRCRSSRSHPNQSLGRGRKPKNEDKIKKEARKWLGRL